MIDVAFAKPVLPGSGALVLLIAEEARPSGLWQQVDEATGGGIGRALSAAEFTGGKGKTCTILAPGAGLSRVIGVGLGKPAERNQRVLTEAGSHAVAAILREPEAAIAADGLSPEEAAEVALGAVLRAY